MTAPAAADPDAVVDAALACPDVARMWAGAVGEVACYLPGRRVPGVRLTDDGVEVHVVARWGRPLPEVASAVRAAVAPVAPGAVVDVFVDDLEPPSDDPPPVPVAGA